MWPKNMIDCFLIRHLDLFSFKPLSFIFKKTFLKHWGCACKVSPHTAKSSWELALPGMSEVIEITSLWKSSLAEWIPYSKCLKQYLPEGVPNISEFELCSSTLIWQVKFFKNDLPPCYLNQLKPSKKIKKILH